MKGSITEKNTKITVIADIIQYARRVLADSNNTLRLSSADTRRIILFCLLYLRCSFSENAPTNINFLEVMEKLGLPELGQEMVIGADVEDIVVDKAIDSLSDIMHHPDWKELLNYSFEALEYDTDQYFSAAVNRGVRNSYTKKKNLGIYYTPDDVVTFMTSRCLEELIKIKDYPSIMDCSVGSGIFILSCINYLDNVYNTAHDLEKSLYIFENCIWGVDISGVAIDSCKIACAQYYIDHYGLTPDLLSHVWRVIDNSFFVGDATRLYETLNNTDGMPVRYDCIIGNPPYVTIGRSTNLFISFVDNMITYSSDVGSSALVVPLSVCYAKGEGYTELRERIENDRAVWEFYNFDRSPDSLFGDQVKTRNTILFRRANRDEKGIYTTTLQRWTSENRRHLFDRVDLCDISGIEISNAIPKISGEEAAYVYGRLHSGPGCLFDLLSSHKNTSAELIMNGTAYNWLCVYDHFPPSIDENGQSYHSGTAKKLYAMDEDARDFCIALISNRIAYWYWIATGDGFHFNTAFLSEYHVGKETFSAEQYNELCRLGREYSKKIKQFPTVSYNAGKKIVNYSHWDALDIVKKTEEIIICGMDLPRSFGEHIEKWYNDQVHCDRS